MKTLGNFRGVMQDAGVNLSSGGFPQFVAKLYVEEMYDEQSKEWAPYEEFFDEGAAEANDRTIFYFGVLFGKNGATRNNDQVKLITGWEGDSFTSLAAMDHEGTKIQWRNVENTYEGVTTVQVGWIDEHDAAPGGSVKKIDDKALAELDAKFAEFLDGKTAAPEKPKARRGKKAEPATDVTSDAPADTPAEEPEKPKSRRGRKKKDVLPTGPEGTAEALAVADTTAETAPPEPAALDENILLNQSGPCTKQEAWNDVNAGKKTDVDVKQLTTVWQAVLAKVAPNKAAAEITGEDWSAVRAGVLDEIGA